VDQIDNPSHGYKLPDQWVHKVKRTGRILLVLPLPLYLVGDETFLDTQACHTLRFWLENFDAVTLMGPQVICNEPPAGTSNNKTIVHGERLLIAPLPDARSPHRFMTQFPAASAALWQQITSANYLHFAIGGIWGDWAAAASIIAYRAGLKYAVWTDRVESTVERFANLSRTGVKKVYWKLCSSLMERLERRVIQRSSLGLFNGTDCFDAYASFCSNPHLVFNIATGEDNIISSDALAKRLNRGEVTRIVYVGRAHQEKGIFDWIDALAAFKSDYQATWFGEGPELSQARNRVEILGLSNKISFPGAINHQKSMENLKISDIFLFCHKTPESPRNLIEALQCGLPIVGYGSKYSQGLIEVNSGGRLTPPNDISALAQALQDLCSTPGALLGLSTRAVADGSRFTDESVFKARSDLMKTIPKQALYDDDTIFSAMERAPIKRPRPLWMPTLFQYLVA
jgi:colanic acid/amylovoran biosynthesis glycosyltransferase